VAGVELVGGLEKKARVLSFQVSDAQSILLFEPAGRGPSGLAIPAGALGGAFPQHGATQLVDAINCGLRQPERAHGIYRLQGHDRVGQCETPPLVSV
jgi:hypothetical protein